MPFRTETIRLIQRVGTNSVVKTGVGLPWRWGYADGIHFPLKIQFILWHRP
jgi:hypothetical protein